MYISNYWEECVCDLAGELKMDSEKVSHLFIILEYWSHPLKQNGGRFGMDK